MPHQSDEAAKLIARLSQLADRLAVRNLVVGSLHADYLFFGSWRLVVFNRHEAVRFFWDGREHEITVDISPIRDLSFPNEWSQDVLRGLHRPDDDPLQFVEEYLSKRYWTDESPREATDSGTS